MPTPLPQHLMAADVAQHLQRLVAVVPTWSQHRPLDTHGYTLQLTLTAGSTAGFSVSNFLICWLGKPVAEISATGLRFYWFQRRRHEAALLACLPRLLHHIEQRVQVLEQAALSDIQSALVSPGEVIPMPPIKARTPPAHTGTVLAFRPRSYPTTRV